MDSNINCHTLKGPQFLGINSFMHLPLTRNLESADYAIIGVPLETLSSDRLGAKFAADEIRRISMTLRNQNLNLNINIPKELTGVDYGDINVKNYDLQTSLKKIEDLISEITEKRAIPIIIGGDHFLSLAKIRAMSKKYGALSLIIFDSHLDYNDSWHEDDYAHDFLLNKILEEKLIDVKHSVHLGLRGTIDDETNLLRIIQNGMKVITTSDIRNRGIKSVCNEINSIIGDNPTFCSFDISFIDPAFAPASGRVSVGGFSVHETFECLRGLCCLNFVGLEVVEFVPAYDPTQRTACAAANLIHEFLAILAFKKNIVKRKAKNSCE
nr:arginase family protein [uncultured Aminipila sp.]